MHLHSHSSQRQFLVQDSEKYSRKGKISNEYAYFLMAIIGERYFLSTVFGRGLTMLKPKTVEDLTGQTRRPFERKINVKVRLYLKTSHYIMILDCLAQ